MSDRECEEQHDAPPPPGFSTPTKADRNDPACHAEPDAEGTEDESDADVEKQFEESDGQEANISVYWRILSANTLKSSGGRPSLILYWSPNKSIMKFTRSWRIVCSRAA